VFLGGEHVLVASAHLRPRGIAMCGGIGRPRGLAR
jgi:hypothetical protein